MFFSLKWMPIHDRIKFHKATMVYKSVDDLLSNYMKDMFAYVWDSHSRTRRSSVKNDLYLPTGKYKELYIQSFANSGAKIWNSVNSCHSQSAKSKQFYECLYHKLFWCLDYNIFNVILMWLYPFLTFSSLHNVKIVLYLDYPNI